MNPFWTFARRMLRHRRQLGPAMLFALLSAGGLGLGLLGMLTVLEYIFPVSTRSPVAEPQNLRTLAQHWAARAHDAAGISIPDAWLALLPTGRMTSLVWLMAALGVLTVLGAAANFLHAYLSLTVISRTIADIRRDAFRRVVHLPLRTVLSSGPSDLISRIVYDTATLAQGFNATLSRGVAQVTKGAAALAVAFIVNWWLALAGLLVAPLLVIIIRKLGKRIRRASRSALQAQADLYRAASEALSGLRVVKVHTAERAEAARFHRINRAVVYQEFRVRTARALASPLVETITLFVVGLLVLVAAKAIIDGHLDPKDLVAVMTFLGIAGASLKPLTGILNDVQQSSGAASRLAQLLALPTEPGHGIGLPALPRHRVSIEFRGVSLRYPGAAAPALDAVSLAIPFGQTVAFVGANGSGKTTLLSLVPRLFDPDQGAVLIDAHDARGFSVRSLRRQIAVVTQETVLFSGTFAFNIAFGADGASPDSVRDAARRARADEFILDRPDGYESHVGESGSALSGGQRQRIAIARAILRDPAILILDEATSMVDADSEAKINAAISEFVSPGGHSGRTCLIVAHRLSTVLSADRIVVLDAGRVVGDGSHDHLLRTCPAYRLIADRQLLRHQAPFQQALQPGA